MTPLRGVILDVDGTLIDSNDAHARAWQDALAAESYEVPFEEVRRLIGMGGDNLLPELIGVEKDSPLGQRLSQSRSEIFKSRYLSTLKAFPQVPDLLARLRQDGFKIVVASSAQKDELEQLLEIAGANDFVQHETSSDDAERSKPEPDIVQAAVAKTGHKPAETLMLGDTPYDIQAAQKAGVPTIALRCGGWSDQALAGAVAIYDDPADLLAHYDSSPLGQNK